MSRYDGGMTRVRWWARFVVLYYSAFDLRYALPVACVARQAVQLVPLPLMTSSVDCLVEKATRPKSPSWLSERSCEIPGVGIHSPILMTDRK